VVILTLERKMDMMHNEAIKMITIRDYNYLFLAFYALSVVPFIVYVYLYNPGGVSQESLDRNIFFILPIMMIPYLIVLKNAHGKRKIIIDLHDIRYLHHDTVLESIPLDEITDIRRTYSDYYHSSQNVNPLAKPISYILFPLAIHIHLSLLLSKFFFHLKMDGLQSYRFYDAVIVFSGNRFINILPSTAEEYASLEKFFKAHKNIDLSDTKLYFEFSHLPEKIKRNDQ
jgi:hypothetical protein